MANDTNKLSVRDGLINIVSAERFQRQPRADGAAGRTCSSPEVVSADTAPVPVRAWRSVRNVFCFHL